MHHVSNTIHVSAISVLCMSIYEWCYAKVDQSTLKISENNGVLFTDTLVTTTRFFKITLLFITCVYSTIIGIIYVNLVNNLCYRRIKF